MPRCPTCSELLFRRRIEGVEADGCPACGGVWLDKGELHALATSVESLRMLGRVFVPTARLGPPQRTGLCPRCNEPLVPFEFDKFRGVRLDRCKSCAGIWLDHGEAESIAGKLAPRAEQHQASASTFGPAAAQAQPAPGPSAPNPAVSSGLELASAPSAVAARFGATAPASSRIADPEAGPSGDPEAGPSGDPSERGFTGRFWEAVRTADTLTIKQQFEVAELFGFETRNKYAIQANIDWIGFAAEQGRGGLAFLARQFLGHWRAFEITIFDQARVPMVTAFHPFRWLFQRLEISLADGTFLGAIQQRFSFFSKRFDVTGRDGRLLMTVNSPFWRLWTFPFVRGGKEVAVVSKRWAGLLTEGFTDRDTFTIKLSPSLSDAERALLLAAGLFIDLQYFEHKAHN